MSRRDEILAKIQTIPALPVAGLEVAQILQDPEASASSIRHAIQHDPGLTSNVLRLANSAGFGGERSVSSIRDAVSRMGTAYISRLVMAAVTEPVVRVAVKGYGLSPGQLWEHSAAVALGTDKLAEVCGIKAPPSAFTAGLLHDIGKILLGTFVEVDAAPIMALAAQERVPFDEAERRILGIDHTEAGAALLESWKLPLPVVEAVRWHHQPESGSGEVAVDLVHAAACLLESIGAGSDGLNYRPSSQVAARLKLSSKINEMVICRTLSALEELHRLFARPEEN